jgi:Domain of unknown function (DUF5109)/Domain of unknown function (DUF4434)
MKIKGTFIDEISHDIPAQNWGEAEWDADFAHMKAIGIELVILIRCGYRRFLTYPSAFLIEKNRCFEPSVDLVAMYLRLAEKHGLDFYFGTYDSGHFWDTGNIELDYALNLRVIEEVWAKYGASPAFKGWYLSLELCRYQENLIEAYRKMGEHAKAVSGGLPVIMSPYIDGKKAVMAHESNLSKNTEGVSLKEHEREWDMIFDGIKSGVDIVAFQDGHVDFDELPDFLRLNKKLADKHGITCWTNSESFDRDMPIKFLPIKWEKLQMKLDAAAKAGIEGAITFEFSHFMSPQSAYLQAGHLYNRYREWLSKNS